jgi:lipopolysaccharide export system protein LptC
VPPEPAAKPRRGWSPFRSRRPEPEAAAAAPAAADSGQQWREQAYAEPTATPEPAAPSARRKLGLFRSRRSEPAVPPSLPASEPVEDQAGEAYWAREPEPAAIAAEGTAAYWSTQPVPEEPAAYWREDAGHDLADPQAIPAYGREAGYDDAYGDAGYRTPAAWPDRPAAAGARAYVPGASAAAARAAAEAGERNIRFDPTKERGPEYHDTARRHSRRVRLLKVALPTIAVLSVIGFFAVMSFYGDDDGTQPALNLSGVDFDQREIIMGTPNISGFEGTKRSYEIHAEKAVQAFGDTKVITLKTITAKFALGDDTRANLEAVTGVYDSNTQKLKLSGGIKLTTTNGYTAELKDADVDVEAGNVDSTTGVSIRGKEGVITSDSIEVRDRGKHVFFRGNVKVVFTPSEKDEKPDAAGSTADAASPAPASAPAPATAPAIIQAAPDGST